MGHLLALFQLTTEMKGILKVIFNFSLIVINSSTAIKPFSLAEALPAFQTVHCGFIFSVANVATLKGVFPFFAFFSGWRK